ncbi:hypothetical protein [Roseateles sp. BYS96W]|uniref:Acetyltransferase n=1 Tax=Pelomonas nitida TaxID=3299027 RepID=A0ABW7G2K5_9BURK
MHGFDLFNGDADGLCSLHQLRLCEPRSASLVTGVKREIDLLRHLPEGPSLEVTALDLCFDRNAGHVRRVLEAGGTVQYFDHHAASLCFEHPCLRTCIDPSPEVCTALLVDRHVGGRHRDWAITGAFGDNLLSVAEKLAQERGHGDEATLQLRNLGLLLNYNAYGETVQDLHFHPQALYEALHAFESPFDFVVSSPHYQALADGYRDDQQHAQSLRPHRESDDGALYLLPAAPWARRLSGTLANALTQRSPGACVALLTARAEGGYVVSVRTRAGVGADVLCRRYADGNGRAGAAGIDRLPEAELDRFIADYFRHIERGT